MKKKKKGWKLWGGIKEIKALWALHTRVLVLEGTVIKRGLRRAADKGWRIADPRERLEGRGLFFFVLQLTRLKASAQKTQGMTAAERRWRSTSKPRMWGLQIMFVHLWFFLESFPAAGWCLPRCRSGKRTAAKGTSRWPSSSWCTPGTQRREETSSRNFSSLDKNVTSAADRAAAWPSMTACFRDEVEKIHWAVVTVWKDSLPETLARFPLPLELHRT